MHRERENVTAPREDGSRAVALGGRVCDASVRVCVGGRGWALVSSGNSWTCRRWWVDEVHASAGINLHACFLPMQQRMRMAALHCRPPLAGARPPHPPHTWCTSRSRISTRRALPWRSSSSAVTARSLRMQKPVCVWGWGGWGGGVGGVWVGGGGGWGGGRDGGGGAHGGMTGGMWGEAPRGCQCAGSSDCCAAQGMSSMLMHTGSPGPAGPLPT
jgi:uncharacterized membrane protein YgcG